MYYLLVSLVGVLVFVVALKMIGVQNLKLTDIIQVQILYFKQSRYLLSPRSNIEFVISRDGNIYKIHLMSTFRGDRETSLNNARLLVSGIGPFVKRLMFAETGGVRSQTTEAVVLNPDCVHELNFEFEPQAGWNPLTLRQGAYKALLEIQTLDKLIRHKFKFTVRARNLEAIEYIKSHYPTSGPTPFISVPIVS